MTHDDRPGKKRLYANNLAYDERVTISRYVQVLSAPPQYENN
jgi:hypothetical protein